MVMRVKAGISVKLVSKNGRGIWKSPSMAADFFSSPVAKVVPIRKNIWIISGRTSSKFQKNVLDDVLSDNLLETP